MKWNTGDRVVLVWTEPFSTRPAKIVSAVVEKASRERTYISGQSRFITRNGNWSNRKELGEGPDIYREDDPVVERLKSEVRARNIRAGIQIMGREMIEKVAKVEDLHTLAVVAKCVSDAMNEIGREGR